MSETYNVPPAPASGLVIVATREVQVTVEQLKEVFKDLEEEPLIEEIPEKLDLNEYFSSNQLAQPLEVKEARVFYGHVVRFRTVENARIAVADYNSHKILESPHRSTQITIFHAGPEYITSATTAEDKNKIIHPPYSRILSFMISFYTSWLVVLLQMSSASTFGRLGGAYRRFKQVFSSSLFPNREFAGSNLVRADSSFKGLDNLIQSHSLDLLEAIEGLRREMVTQNRVSSGDSKPLVQANGDEADSGISNVLRQMEADIQSQTLRSDTIREGFDDLKKSMKDENVAKQREFAKLVHLQELLVAKENVARLEILAVRNQFSDLQTTVKQVTDDTAARGKELDDAIQSVWRLTCDIRDLQNTASFQEASVKAEKAQWETELKAYSTRIQDLEKTNQKLESSLTSVTTEAVSLRSEADAARKTCQTVANEYQKQVEALNACIKQLKLQSASLTNELATSDASIKQRSAECERWRIQCQVSEAEITRLKEEIEGKAEQRRIESRREEYLKNQIEAKYGRADQLVAWDDDKAFNHLHFVLSLYDQTVFRKEKPLTMRGVPWPVMDDPRWHFTLQNIQPVTVETFLRKYHLVVTKNDNSMYATFLCRLKAVFHQDKWNPTHRLSTVSSPGRYEKAGLVVFKVVEAELKKLVLVPKTG